MLNLNKKLKVFQDICGDWNYRDIDMTEPHLQGIQIINNNIGISCELFSPKIDEYVSCDGGIINDKKLVKKFKKLDLENKNDVLDFISNIECLINWDEVSNKLSSEVEEELLKMQNEEIEEEFDYDDFDSDAMDVPCEKLGEGWFWHKYDDGSGCLKSPDGKEYMSYDLQTNEYKVTNECSYDLFPLNYYYIDGVDPSEFDPFDYMEQEMVDYVLPKENEKEEVCL